jgi:hypothetical protein
MKTGSRNNSIYWFLMTLVGIALLTAIGPAEKSLGVNVRVVYLHGVWVWTALLAFIAAALTGLFGLITSKESLQRWSLALGRTGLIFWITYLPLSMWAMQTNWNGLFLAEPRFRFAVIFTISGLLLQVGVTLLENPAWASGANMLFAVALFLSLLSTESVMHPESPILNSDSRNIQLFFAALLLLTLLAAGQLTRLLYQFDRSRHAAIERREATSLNQ